MGKDVEGVVASSTEGLEVSIPERQRFQGREEGLQGHIYDLQAHKSPDQYIQTTHEITSYIGRIHKKHTAIFMKAIEALELDMPLEPDDPDKTSAVAMEGGRSSSRSTIRRPMHTMTSLHTYTTLSWDNALWDWRPYYKSSSNSPTRLRTDTSWLLLYVK